MSIFRLSLKKKYQFIMKEHVWYKGKDVRSEEREEKRWDYSFPSSYLVRENEKRKERDGFMLI